MLRSEYGHVIVASEVGLTGNVVGIDYTEILTHLRSGEVPVL